MIKQPSTTKNVLMIGGLLLDDIAIPDHSLKPASSNPVKWQHKLGGVAANVARVAVRQLNVHFIASIGDDNTGDRLSIAIQQAQFSHTLTAELIIRTGHHSDKYTAILQPDGELYLGLADAQLTACITWHEIVSRLPENKPDGVVLDANLSETCIADLLHSLNAHYAAHIPVFGLAVSPSKALRYLPMAEKLDVLFCNRREAAALTEQDWQTELTQLADAMLMLRFQSFVITDGDQPMLVQAKQKRDMIAVPSVQISRNVNGAGDALAGATIASMITGQSLANAAQHAGLSAAREVLTGKSEPPLI